MVVVQLIWSSLGVMSGFCFVLLKIPQCATAMLHCQLHLNPTMPTCFHPSFSWPCLVSGLHCWHPQYVSNPNKSHPNCAKQIADCRISLLLRLRGKYTSSLNNPVTDIYTGLKRRISTLALGGQKMAQYFTLLLRGFLLLFPSGW